MFRSTIAQAVAFIVLALQAALPALGSAGEPFVWVESWRHAATVPVERAAAGDVDGDGVPELAVLAGGTVTVYSLDPEGPRPLGAIRSPSGRFTAVAVADYDGDGAAEVWTGTSAPGIVQIYSFEDGAFRLVNDLRYVWEDVRLLIPLDLDGWGRTDLAVVTSGGLSYVYRWNGDAFERHELGALQRGVRFAAGGDIDADGMDELVIARGQEHVAALEWRTRQIGPAEVSGEPGAGRRPDASSPEDPWDAGEGGAPATPSGAVQSAGELAVRWENFVWGGHTHLAVGDFLRAPGAEVFLSTSRGLVYVFDSGNGGAQGQPDPQSRLILPDQVVGIGDLDFDGVAELLIKSESGIEAWDVSPFRMSMRLATPVQPVESVHIMDRGGVMAVSGPWGFSRYDRREAGYVRVIRNGAVLPLAKEAVVTEASIYLSAADWEALTGMRLRFDPSSGRVTGIRGFHFLVGDVRGGDWIYNGRPLQIAHPPLVKGGDLYLPIDFAGAVGVAARWDPFARTLLVER